MPYRDSPEDEAGEDVAVAAYDAPHEAHLAVLHLETKGIEAHITNDMVVGMAPHLGSGMAGVRVMVRHRDAAEAHAHLEKLRVEVRRERDRRQAHDLAPAVPGRRASRSLLWMLLLGAGFAAWTMAKCDAQRVSSVTTVTPRSDFDLPV